jgi:hypothetical protein
MVVAADTVATDTVAADMVAAVTDTAAMAASGKDNLVI